jgi:catechol 2,3-dioxygenase
MIGRVRLRVADADRVRSYYEDTIGLREIDGVLGADTPLVELIDDPDARPAPAGSTGLFHLAILVPDRASLASAVRRVVASGERFTGASDHFVSEALYLRDPEGNGIEIYRDRLREEWRYDNGRLQMDTLPLDLDGVLAELSAADAGDAIGVPNGTRIGHVHLSVAKLSEAEDFYGGLLGFEVTVRDYPGALFFATGGYHHQIGVNTWAGEGAAAPPPGSLGLGWFAITLPSAPELEQVGQRLRAAGFEAQGNGGGLRIADPSGNGILLT